MSPAKVVAAKRCVGCINIKGGLPHAGICAIPVMCATFVCVRVRFFVSPGLKSGNECFSFGYGHTWYKVPDPIRTRKSNYHGRRQYCGGGPRGNTTCRNLFFLFSFLSRFSDMAGHARCSKVALSLCRCRGVLTLALLPPYAQDDASEDSEEDATSATTLSLDNAENGSLGCVWCGAAEAHGWGLLARRRAVASSALYLLHSHSRQHHTWCSAGDESTGVVLDVSFDPRSESGLRFIDVNWEDMLPSLKPLGLNVLLNTNCNQPWLAMRLADHVRYLSLMEVRCSFLPPFWSSISSVSASYTQPLPGGGALLFPFQFWSSISFGSVSYTRDEPSAHCSATTDSLSTVVFFCSTTTSFRRARSACVS